MNERDGVGIWNYGKETGCRAGGEEACLVYFGFDLPGYWTAWWTRWKRSGVVSEFTRCWWWLTVTKGKRTSSFTKPFTAGFSVVERPTSSRVRGHGASLRRDEGLAVQPQQIERL
jgi:hypothetical protein